MKQVRRRSHRRWLGLLGIFVMVFLFTFLLRNFKKPEEEVEAASLANFDPGYIISDYTMGNYNAMTEAEIQAFLLAKGNCRDTRTYLADYYTGYSYHIKDGHFVCLAEETFGEGVAYGEAAPGGESAAHVIWQAAQDYRINPQVLIVLLQKEQGLITDSWPNSRQFKVATGYGCPDTAPCDAQYYGFKNQVRKAAALFRTVLDGGWTNYPLGENYIQYNPSAECGGSVVNIRSLATSALYRYTPYQPNAEALAAGYGTAYCGAYGNRNFYLYFEDWFSGITSEAVEWSDMDTPRYMVVGQKTFYYDLNKGGYSSVVLDVNKMDFYSDKVFLDDGKMCLRTRSDKENNNARCVLYDNLKEANWKFGDMETARYLRATEKSKILDLSTMREVGRPSEYEFYDKKVFLPDGEMCLKIRGRSGAECVYYGALEEIEYEIYNMEYPRYLTPSDYIAEIIDPVRDIRVGYIKQGDKKLFEKKILLPDGDMCLLTEEEGYKCIRFSELNEAWVEMERPRFMQMIVDSYKISAVTFERDYEVFLTKNLQRRFVKKRYLRDGEWCLQTEYDDERKTDNCILYSELSEL